MKSANTFETVKKNSKQDFSSWDKYGMCDSMNILINNTWLKPVCQTEEVKEFALGA